MSIPAATAYWQIGGDTSQVWSSERVGLCAGRRSRLSELGWRLATK